MILPAQTRPRPDKKNLRTERHMSTVLSYYFRYCKEIRRKLLYLRRVNTDKPTPGPLAICPSDVVARLVNNIFYLRQIRLGCYVLR